jgi:hypothetical protein
MLSLDGTGRCGEDPFAFHTGTGCSYAGNMVRDGKLHAVHSHAHPQPGAPGREWPCLAIRRSMLDVQIDTA